MTAADYYIIASGDGSASVGISGTNISFHSTRGAFTESMQVFIENGLNYYLEAHRPAELSILEIGFGTGLNALLTAQAINTQKGLLRYTSVDRYPLTEAVYSRLNYGAFTRSPDLYQQLMTAAWGQEVRIGDKLLLKKIEADLQEYQPDQQYDICYFDAFAPEDQPELWTIDIFKKIRSSMSEGGVLVTYCSKSVVRRTLQEAGFVVQKLKGPPGKREVVRAVATSMSPGN
ncbi:tRNA (5-methylaminomethyl-2-thiouridine)(34)-methyltransferase MnmD [Niabella drilacis]|uniref:tRNA U34 5-methylaminomethyl-2-thiouridine-forming methyltransferase MnmC n=1 Tax=Niabella drilacis (strain DSM 25811 / CCM 8410 / CCUG 62505 / LMG 26954 / E90) TaxID=1285928 RepID=A0A1G6KJX5_NIADE|nr:tRNA (5-methylaminomethyl-2-thiouridine)(34)-methyltransferase MnmD [Niabella drilacis]SDC31340.1 tRNA U34 5-methylaminomethyl-2-thiouridine-forming methyltransferase MnmC [Niabella drilacis]